MKIAYIIFDGITWLDFIGVYDALSRLRSMHFIDHLQWDVCAFTEPAADNHGLRVVPQLIKPSLKNYDVIMVPGGHGTRQLVNDREFLEWLKDAEHARYKLSVCTGSLLLGAAGFLTAKRATTNFLEYNTLQQYCKEVVHAKVVEDGDTITAGAVANSIDLGLYLCEKWAGAGARDVIKQRMGV